jgi:hypothetical protein
VAEFEKKVKKEEHEKRLTANAAKSNMSKMIIEN